MQSTDKPAPSNEALPDSDSAFLQIFGGAALAFVWSVMSGIIVLILDGPWQVMAIAAYLFVVAVTFVLMVCSRGLRLSAIGFGICVFLAISLYWLLEYSG